jgi:CheY-like chemotaxis protein
VKKIYTPAKKKTILIVDDDQVAVHMYQEQFQSQGYNMKVASNDHSAMEMLKLKKDPIDLMILDLCLPGMDGVEVLKNIRSEFDMQALPVIVISNAYLGNLGRAALEAGATKCVTKADGTTGQMLELVRELIGVGHSNAASATSEVVVSNSSGTLAPQFDAEFREELVAMLLINAPETLAKLRTGHQVFARTELEDSRRTELSKMHRQVRWLAASASPLGFRKIAHMANALEALLIQLHAKPKKITPSVIRTVAQAIDTLASLFDQATNPQTEGLVPPKILVVDDEIISRETICSALGQADLHAVSLDDSLAAQHLLEQEQFDLIFLDVEMPGESGLDLCMNIREMPTNRATPVVFVTAHSDFGSRAQSTLSGGNDFIAKPFLLVELAVKALTWLFKENPEPVSTATAQDSAPPETSSHESQPYSGHTAPSDTYEEAPQLRASVAKFGARSFKRVEHLART